MGKAPIPNNILPAERKKNPVSHKDAVRKGREKFLPICITGLI